MVKYAGLNITARSIRGVLIEKDGKSIKAKETFSANWLDGETMKQALTDCVQKFGEEVRWMVGIPHMNFSIRHLTFPFSARNAISAALAFEMESLLPYPASEMETSYLKMSSTKEETKLLAFAIRKEKLLFYRNALKEAGLHADFITSGAVALLHFNRFASGFRNESEPENALLGDIEGNSISLCFTGSDGFCDILETEANEKEIPRFLSAMGKEPSIIIIGGADSEGFAGSKYALPDSWKEGMAEFIGEAEKPEGLIVPIGLAAMMEAGTEEPVLVADPERKLALPSSLRYTAIGAIACAVITFSYSIYSYYSKQNMFQELQEQSVKAFNVALPGVKVVKPTFQLEQRLDLLQQKLRLAGLAGTGRMDLLWILQRLSETIPNDVPMEIDELLYEGDGVTISGKSDKLESITKIKGILSTTQPFKDCEVLDSRASADGKKISFKMRLQL
jgi:hypothetical protein